MPTSGTTTFDLDITDIIEEAYELTGSELRGGYEMRTARRSLNLMMREWGNRGINFWTVRENSVVVSPDQQDVILPNDTIDILDAVWRTGSGTGQNDRILTRIDMVEWAQTSNKNMPALPTQFYVQRIVPPVVRLWPRTPVEGTFVYWGLRSIQDAGSYGNNMDVPYRFLPAMTSGLAYYLALKNGALDANRVAALKAEYDRQFQLAAEEDRERTPFRLVPDLSRGR